MIFAPELLVATSIRRTKRFILEAVGPDGGPLLAHCTNTGTMKSCFTPGCRVALSLAANPKRRLPYTLELSECDGRWVGVNTANANTIAGEAIAANRFPSIGHCDSLRREVPYAGNSRVDFLMNSDGKLCYIEVKNVSMIDGNGGCCFPDARTARGLKHLHDLIAMRKQGHRALILFVCQREDANYFRPAFEIDPGFADALADARAAGVEAAALQASVSTTRLELVRELPIQQK